MRIQQQVAAEYVMTPETYKFQLKDAGADPYDANSYEYIIDSTAEKASCVKLTIGGYCSTKADWSAYTDGTNELKLDMVFKFKKAATTTGDWTDTTTGTDEVKVGPQVSWTKAGVITIKDLTAKQNFKGLTITDSTGLVQNVTAGPYTQDLSKYDASTGGELVITLGTKWIDYLKTVDNAIGRLIIDRWKYCSFRICSF